MESNKKILFIMHMPPPVHGAAVVGKQIYDSHLVRSTFDCVFLNPAASDNVEEIGRFSLKKLMSMVRFYHLVRRTIQQEKPQLVYITPSTWDWGFYRDCITMWILKSHRCSVVAHFHNKPKLSFTQKWYNKKLYKYFFNNIDSIFLANRLAETFYPYISPVHIHICPNGMPDFTNNFVSPNEHIFTFLFVSNMMLEKGVYVLLDACAVLKEKGLQFCCNFVGRWSDVSYEDFSKKCAELHVEDCVSYLGAKYDKEKDVCFCQADAFVFPTFYHGECLSLVVIEAMQHALPIITTDEGALPEVVNDGTTGYVIEKQNAIVLAEKMQFLLEHPQNGKQMGRNGRLKYEGEYTVDIFEKRLTSILLDCLQK